MENSDNEKKTRMVRVADEASGLTFYVELTDEQGMEMSRLMGEENLTMFEAMLRVTKKGEAEGNL